MDHKNNRKVIICYFLEFVADPYGLPPESDLDLRCFKGGFLLVFSGSFFLFLALIHRVPAAYSRGVLFISQFLWQRSLSGCWIFSCDVMARFGHQIGVCNV